MLSIPGRMGHLLLHPDFDVDRLNVIHTGLDGSFTASSRL